MKKLKKVYIEITNCCNLSCAFCPGTSRESKFMSAAEFTAVLERLCGFTDHLYLHIMGEPLLHPELNRFLELCEQYGYKVNITTNGLLIGNRAQTLLSAEALRQINFSLHSQEDSSDIGHIREYLKSIVAFADQALLNGRIFVSYRLWNLSSKLAAEYNGLVLQQLEEHYKPGLSLMEEIQRNKRVRIRERLYLNSDEVFQWPSLAADDMGSEGFCLGLRDQVGILVDGTVVPCCLDSGGIIRLGNIFENDFQHIMNGERARALYDGFSGRKAVEELCRKCGYRIRFSGDNRG